MDKNTVSLSFVSHPFGAQAVTEAVVLVSYVEKGDALCFDLVKNQDSKSIETMRIYMGLLPNSQEKVAW